VTTLPRDVRVRRVYEQASPWDGKRVLVDRLWPRGLTKAGADLYEWCRVVAPSTELRVWYGQDRKRFEEFCRRYTAELLEDDRAAALRHLQELARDGTLTLLTASRNPDISEAAVLAGLLIEADQAISQRRVDHAIAPEPAPRDPAPHERPHPDRFLTRQLSSDGFAGSTWRGASHHCSARPVTHPGGAPPRSRQLDRMFPVYGRRGHDCSPRARADGSEPLGWSAP
jgi:uncharacterized protein YeaO (DUF488 family)